MPVEVLIVGQGLAGSLLAWQLIEQGFRVLVIDDGAENASQVAAGLINPVTGLRLLKSADSETLLAAAHSLYRQLECYFKQAFLIEMPMLRVLQSEQQYQFARQRLADPDYQTLLGDWLPDVAAIQAPFGCLQQRQTGYLRTQALLAALRQWLIDRQSYQCGRFDYQQLTVQPRLQWRELQPRWLVFCEGHQGRRNPWFGNLPFQVVQGEIVSAVAATLLPPQIINYGHWLLPQADGSFKTGATFDNQILDGLPTASARQQLLASLQAVMPALGPLKLTGQRVGIRPATRDKQPFIGSHPALPQLCVFNGFGAKGSLAIPWYAQQLIAYFQQGRPLPGHCNIQRFL